MGNANCCEMTKLNCSELKEDPPLMSYDAKAYPDPGSSRNVTNGVSFTVLRWREINELNTYALPHFLFVLCALCSCLIVLFGGTSNSSLQATLNMRHPFIIIYNINNAECLCKFQMELCPHITYCVPYYSMFFQFSGAGP